MKEETKNIRWFTLEEKTPSENEEVLFKLNINNGIILFGAYYDKTRNCWNTTIGNVQFPDSYTECEWMSFKDLL